MLTFMKFEERLANAEIDINKRLIESLEREKLVTPALTPEERLEISGMRPWDALKMLRDNSRLNVPTNNIQRTIQELRDGIRGLALARQGRDERWANMLLTKTNSSSPFQDLVEACLNRCRGYDRTASALLAKFEQLVTDGHHAHPCAKTCLGLGADYRFVLPEQVEQLELRFLAAHQSLVEETGMGIQQALSDTLPTLASRIHDELKELGLENFLVIPVHPWQLENVILEEFAKEFRTRQLVVLDSVANAEPLMSVRTFRVTHGNGSVHIKVALEAQLTGAIRGFSPTAAIGPDIKNIFDVAMTANGGIVPRTQDDDRAFSTGEDLAAIRYSGTSGLRERCLGALIRKDPTSGCLEKDIAMPVAALFATNPLTGRKVIDDIFIELKNQSGPGMEKISLITEWTRQLCDILVAPVVSMLAVWGISVEAHQQNTVLILRNNFPHKVIVRDFGGVRIFPKGDLSLFPDLAQYFERLSSTSLVVDDIRKLVNKAIYPLISNLFEEFVVKLNLKKDEAEQIWTILASCVERVRFRLVSNGQILGKRSHNFRKQVFETIQDGKLPVKRLLGMRLSGAVREQEYVYIKNPLDINKIPIATQLRAGKETIMSAKIVVDGRLRAAAQIEGISTSEFGKIEADVRNAIDCLAQVSHLTEKRIRAHQQRQMVIGRQDSSFWSYLQSKPAQLSGAYADKLAVSGHNVHPLAKLRRGFSVEDSWLYGPENDSVVDLVLLAVHRDLIAHSCISVESGIFDYYPDLIRLAKDIVAKDFPVDHHKYDIIFVHPWQYKSVIIDNFKNEIDAGLIKIIEPCVLPVHPTISLRTGIPHVPDEFGRRPMVKTAIDIVATSTRRSISQDSALGTPVMSGVIVDLVENVLAQYPENHRPRVKVIPEFSGTAYNGTRHSATVQRGLSTLLRRSPEDVLGKEEFVIGANTLRGVPETLDPALSGLIGEHPERWLKDYSFDLLGIVLPMMWSYGVALEAHLQNTLVRAKTSNIGVEYMGVALRDFSGIRILRSRWEACVPDVALRPQAVTVTENVEDFRSKGIYAAISGNLDGIVKELAKITSTSEKYYWNIVTEVLANLCQFWRGKIPEGDLSFLLSPVMAQKSFLRMALDPSKGDSYIMVPNPLARKADLGDFEQNE